MVVKTKLSIVPKVRTVFGRSAFRFAAAFNWNTLQNTLKLSVFTSLSVFKQNMLKITVDSCTCWIGLVMPVVQTYCVVLCCIILYFLLYVIYFTLYFPFSTPLPFPCKSFISFQAAFVNKNSVLKLFAWLNKE